MNPLPPKHVPKAWILRRRRGQFCRQPAGGVKHASSESRDPSRGVRPPSAPLNLSHLSPQAATCLPLTTSLPSAAEHGRLHHSRAVARVPPSRGKQLDIGPGYFGILGSGDIGVNQDPPLDLNTTRPSSFVSPIDFAAELETVGRQTDSGPGILGAGCSEAATLPPPSALALMASNASVHVVEDPKSSTLDSESNAIVLFDAGNSSPPVTYSLPSSRERSRSPRIRNRPGLDVVKCGSGSLTFQTSKLKKANLLAMDTDVTVVNRHKRNSVVVTDIDSNGSKIEKLHNTIKLPSAASPSAVPQNRAELLTNLVDPDRAARLCKLKNVAEIQDPPPILTQDAVMDVAKACGFLFHGDPALAFAQILEMDSRGR